MSNEMMAGLGISAAVVVGLWIYLFLEHRKKIKASKKPETSVPAEKKSVQPTKPESPELIALRIAARESLLLNIQAELAFREMADAARKNRRNGEKCPDESQIRTYFGRM